MNLRLLGRYNKCEMVGVCEATRATLYRGAGIYPCFHAAFAFVDQNRAHICDITYTLYVNKQPDGNYNNFALGSKRDLHRILDSIKYLIPFEYHFEEDATCYIITMHLVGKRNQHKGLLMLSRALFEYPHNICALDALRLREQRYLGDIDISKYTIIQLYIWFLASTDFSADESIINHHSPHLMKSKVFKRRLNTYSQKRVSAIYPKCKHNIRWELFDKPRQVETLFTQEGIQCRINTYINNIKQFLAND